MIVTTCGGAICSIDVSYQKFGKFNTGN